MTIEEGLAALTRGVQITLMECIMPNGQRLAESTGEDLDRFIQQYEQIGSEAGAAFSQARRVQKLLRKQTR
jgi:hypothetical protein